MRRAVIIYTLLCAAFLWSYVGTALVIQQHDISNPGTNMTWPWPKDPEPKPPPCDPCQQCPPGCHKFCRDNNDPCQDWYCAC